MSEPTESEIAWMSGFFDGEGCIWYQGEYVRLMIASSDKDLIYRWKELSQCGNIRVKKTKNVRHKDSYQWFTSKQEDVKRLLLLMVPWFGERRTKKTLESLEKMDDYSRNK